MKHALLLADHFDAVLHGHETIGRATFDPIFLNYPSFLLYMIAGFTSILRYFGACPWDWEAYLIGRLISATAGTCTVLVIYALVRQLRGGSMAALLAATWTALLPEHVWESHVAVTDVLMTLWCTATLLAALRLVDRGRWCDYLLAGMALGLATGSKYTAALAAAAIVLASLLSGRAIREQATGLAITAAAALAACFMVTPYSFFRWRDTLAALSYEHHHTLGHHYGFSLPANGFHYHRYLYELTALFPFSMGLALYGCALAGFIWLVFHLDRRRLVLLGFICLFTGLLASWYFVPLRYYLPVTMLGPAVAALWLSDWHDAGRLRRVAAWILIAVTTVYTGIFAGETTDRYRTETRIQAASFLDSYMTPGTTLVLEGWHRYMAIPAERDRFIIRNSQEKQLDELSKLDTNCIIEVSSLVYERHIRHGNAPFELAYKNIREPGHGFVLIRKYEAYFLNKELYMWMDPMFESYFVSPTLEFYRRSS